MNPRALICLAVAALFAVLSFMVPLGSYASARHPKSESQDFEGSPAWQKLDLRFRQVYQEAMAANDPSRSFECIIKINEAASDDDRTMLAGAGFSARTWAGKIVTGSVTAGKVPQVTGLPIVKVMELAVPLTIKKGK